MAYEAADLHGHLTKGTWDKLQNGCHQRFLLCQYVCPWLSSQL